ncbi:MAG: S8 family serine peptidase [bacterium]
MKAVRRILCICLFILSIFSFSIISAKGANIVYDNSIFSFRNANQTIMDSLIVNSGSMNLLNLGGGNLSNSLGNFSQGLLQNNIVPIMTTPLDPSSGLINVQPAAIQLMGSPSAAIPISPTLAQIGAQAIISPPNSMNNAILSQPSMNLLIQDPLISNNLVLPMGINITPLGAGFNTTPLMNPMNSLNISSSLGMIAAPLNNLTHSINPINMSPTLPMFNAPLNNLANSIIPPNMGQGGGYIFQGNNFALSSTSSPTMTVSPMTNYATSPSFSHLPSNTMQSNNILPINQTNNINANNSSFETPLPPTQAVTQSEGVTQASNNLELPSPPPGEFAIAESNVLRNMNFQSPLHRNEIIVMFQPGTSLDSSNRLHQECGTHLLKISPYVGFHLVAVPNSAVFDNIMLKYNQHPNVLYAEPNYIRHAHLVPNDPYYPYQWHLPHLFTGWAWDISTGVGAIVALLDSGVAYRTSGVFLQAPDLAGTLFTPGYDFVNVDAFPDDDNSHGTFMCGCIAQTTNNLLGVAGVAFNATIMPVKIMDPLGDVTIANEVDGIYFAVNNGADIINLSLGGPGIVTTEQAAVDFAYNSGVVVLSSSGNAGSSTLEYPASYDSCISVGATQYDDTIAPYSNYGTALDIVAPGGNLALDQNLDGWADGILQQTHDGTDFTLFRYYFQEGTSPSCALASGVAALVVSKSTVILTPLQIKNILEGSAIDLGIVGWDQYYGWGKVNAYYALLDTP